MISDKIREIREALENAKNPVFFYDNDADGLCSFVLLRKFLGRGKGVAIRSYPDLDSKYAKRIEEFGSDCVFVLDKPVLSNDFVEEVKKLGVPLIWIDHHDSKEDYSKIYDGFRHYNFDKPVTEVCYRITERKEDMWLAVIGCIADHYLPDFAKEFEKEYPELWRKGIKLPFDAVFGSEIGKIARVVNFGLKDSITNVVALQNFLIKCNSPSQILEEQEDNRKLLLKAKDLQKINDKVVLDAEKGKEGNFVFCSYGGESSISADIANELIYKYPKDYIVIAFIKGGIANLSIRGDNVKSVLEKILKNFENASGGGHRDAVGARLMSRDLDKFKEEFRKEI